MSKGRGDTRRQREKREGPEAGVPRHIKRLLDFMYLWGDASDGLFWAQCYEEGLDASDFEELGEWQTKTPNWRALAGWPEVLPAAGVREDD